MAFDQSNASVASRLGRVDWDFVGSTRRDAIHDLHPYPARFIPQIPRELIRLFHPNDGSAVLDPFCGCGTTLVEAASADLPSIGVDLNPLAVLISKVKTTRLRGPIAEIAGQILERGKGQAASIPIIPRLDHWFEPDIQAALATIMAGIDRIADPDTSDALKVALSRIIVRVSNQDSDTRYAAVKKEVTKEDVFRLFRQSAEAVDAAISGAYEGLFSSSPQVRVLHQDVLSLSPSSFPTPVGLVITSPPYPNAYEYWLYHKYRMYWLGMDPIALRSGEIGARPHYFKKNHQTEVHFEVQMTTVFRTLGQVLAIGGLACFVVGRSIIHGREIDNVQLLTRAAVAGNFALAGSVSRTIAPSRKSFNLSHATIHEETIAVFELRAS